MAQEISIRQSLSRAYKNIKVQRSELSLFKVDHNELNEEFYLELLYIMGLEEIMQDGVAKIVRCAPSRRHRHSLMEETMFALEARSDIATDEECEDVATTFFMTGEHLVYLLVYLNSPLSAYLFSKLGTTTGAGTTRWKKYEVEIINQQADE